MQKITTNSQLFAWLRPRLEAGERVQVSQHYSEMWDLIVEAVEGRKRPKWTWLELYMILRACRDTDAEPMRPLVEMSDAQKTLVQSLSMYRERTSGWRAMTFKDVNDFAIHALDLDHYFVDPHDVTDFDVASTQFGEQTLGVTVEIPYTYKKKY